MHWSPEQESRYLELKAQAPISVRKLWCRDGDRYLLCATLGSEFDRWQRALSAVSAADGYFAQCLGLEAVEQAMDEIESELPLAHENRRSPGYGDVPLAASREILDKLGAGQKIGVMMTESNLLVPTKSVTATCVILKPERTAE